MPPSPRPEVRFVTGILENFVVQVENSLLEKFLLCQINQHCLIRVETRLFIETKFKEINKTHQREHSCPGGKSLLEKFLLYQSNHQCVYQSRNSSCHGRCIEGSNFPDY